MTDRRRYFLCPECASGAFQPFDCGGPHPIIKRNGERGKRLVYRWVPSIEVRPVDDAEVTPS
jgi:hypothetical protein